MHCATVSKKYMQTDIIIVGSGIAGLSLGLKLADKGHSVQIITKRQKSDTNTSYAQGGVACAMGEDDHWEVHLRDTLIAGDGLCDERTVEFIVKNGPKRLQELVEWGVDFCREEDGQWALGQEGGHSKRRILHVKDMTGRAIETALLKAVLHHPRIRMSEHWMAIDLIVADGAEGRFVAGLYALNALSGEVQLLRAKAVVLATGGSGCLYAYTTNPSVATGDGVAMALRAGVQVSGMEFVQFHPTALYAPNGERLLISEAVRGEGAILRDFSGDAFMKKYHHQADLAPRDVVVRAMDQQMKASKAPHVWLDFTHQTENFIQERFPNVWRACQWQAINPAKDWIPVVPAAHYQCGGIAAQVDGSTSLAGLYACGEVASTGLHGANRLASNSLLEAVVMAHEAAEAIDHKLQSEPFPVSKDLALENLLIREASCISDTAIERELILTHNWRELRQLMWDYGGIIRTVKCLEHAALRLEFLKKEVAAYYSEWPFDISLLELRNAIDVSESIIQAALARPKSCGVHYSKLN